MSTRITRWDGFGTVTSDELFSDLDKSYEIGWSTQDNGLFVNTDTLKVQIDLRDMDDCCLVETGRSRARPPNYDLHWNDGKTELISFIDDWEKLGQVNSEPIDTGEGLEVELRRKGNQYVLLFCESFGGIAKVLYLTAEPSLEVTHTPERDPSAEKVAEDWENK